MREGGDAVVLGAGGGLGRALVAELRARGVPVVALARADCDVTDEDALARALSGAPAVVYNAAAYTAVDAAEEDVALARAVNAEAPAALARRCAEVGARLVHYSTDYVFDGTPPAGRPYLESDAPAPRSVYAASKRDGEQAVLDAGQLVLRTAWLYRDGGGNFGSTLAGRLLAGETVRALSDRVGSPTWTGALAALSLALVDRGATGLFHAACREPTTWYDFAARLASRLELPADRVVAIASADLALAAPRPPYSALGSERLGDWRLSMPSWQDAQDDYLRSRR